MNFKKLISLTLAVAMILGVVACDGEPSGKKVTVATGTITGQLNMAYAKEEGDVLAASLIMPTLYEYDRNGQLLLDAAEGKSVTYKNKDYAYRTLADISSEYDQATSISTYTIKVGSASQFANGTKITADDLIYSYYVYCDKSFDGECCLYDSSIVGLKAYQYNNSEAPNVNITDDDIGSALYDPTDELKAAINSDIIKPVLEEGRVFCEENWERYVDRGYGNSAEELFVMLFANAIDSNYQAGDKSFDEIFDDTLALFGMNYKQIARIFYGDVEYLNEKTYNLVKEFLFNKALADSNATEVDYIEGIKKVNDSTITVSAYGNDANLMEEVCDIPVLSKDFYSDTGYNYSTNEFGVTRGDVSVVKSHSTEPLGYGPYEVKYSDNGTIILTPNKNYYGGSAPSVDLKLVNIAKDSQIEAVSQAEADLAIVDLTNENIGKIQNGGNSLQTIDVDSSEYEYIGLNKSTLVPYFPGEDEELDTEYTGYHLRQGLAILLASLRQDAIDSTIGDAGKIIEYPGSQSGVASISESDPDYQKAYSKTSTGETFDDAFEAAKQEFILAGYGFDEDGYVQGAEGVLTTFTVAIPSYQLSDSTMMKLYDSFNEKIQRMGFMLEPVYYEEMDEFLVALTAKSEHIWLAERTTSTDNVYEYYHSNGKLNFYGLKNSTIDSLLDQVDKDSTLLKANYQKVYKTVMEEAVEVPVYQCQSAIVYNPNGVQIADGIDITEFYGIFDIPQALTYPGENSTYIVPTESSSTVAKTTAATTTVATTTVAQTETYTEESTSEVIEDAGGEEAVENG